MKAERLAAVVTNVAFRQFCKHIAEAEVNTLDLVTVAHGAQLLGVSRRTLYRAIEREKVMAYEIDGVHFVYRPQLEQMPKRKAGRPSDPTRRWQGGKATGRRGLPFPPADSKQ